MVESRESRVECQANPSPLQRRAVIDVGTNSVKLLVAEVAGNSIQPLLEQSEQTRLGHGFYPHHRLKPDAIAQTARACAEFAEAAKQQRVVTTRIIATSAARDAVNAAELAYAVEQACGLTLEIISGEQEADWVFQGVSSDPALAGLPLLILDVGGGSTEFILGENGVSRFRRSFSLGSVRLLEQFAVSDPPTGAELEKCRAQIRSYLAREVRPALAAHALSPALQFVGTGGATTILARMHHRMMDFDRARIEGTRMSREQVRAQCELLWSLPLAVRRELPGLPANRADVILFGAAIYEAVMGEFNLPELRASTRGLRYAALMERG